MWVHSVWIKYLFQGIAEVGNIIKKTKIVPDVINIGGGFPSIYPDLIPEPLEN